MRKRRNPFITTAILVGAVAAVSLQEGCVISNPPIDTADTSDDVEDTGDTGESGDDSE